jgi:hypothetical protein
VLGGQRVAREVGAVIDLGGLLGRQKIVLKPQHLRRTARGVAGGQVDRHAFEIVAGAVDEIAALVELEVAATGVEVDAVEHRRTVGEGAGLLHREEAVVAMKVATDAVCTSPCTELVERDCVVTPPASCEVSAVWGMRSRKEVSMRLNAVVCELATLPETFSSA